MWGGSNDNDSFKSNNGGSSSFGSGFGGGSKAFGDSNFGQSLSEVDWSKEQLTPFQKVFYKEQVSQKNKGEVENFYRQNNASAKSPHGDVPDPLLSWSAANFPTYIMNEIVNAKFDKPSPIQSLVSSTHQQTINQ